MMSTPPELKGFSVYERFSPHPRLPVFVHQVIPNGLIVTTCLVCQKVFASPTPAGLKMVETVHKCRGLGYDF